MISYNIIDYDYAVIWSNVAYWRPGPGVELIPASCARRFPWAAPARALAAWDERATRVFLITSLYPCVFTHVLACGKLQSHVKSSEAPSPRKQPPQRFPVPPRPAQCRARAALGGAGGARCGALLY